MLCILLSFWGLVLLLGGGAIVSGYKVGVCGCCCFHFYSGVLTSLGPLWGALRARGVRFV